MGRNLHTPLETPSRMSYVIRIYHLSRLVQGQDMRSRFKLIRWRHGYNGHSATRGVWALPKNMFAGGLLQCLLVKGLTVLVRCTRVKSQLQKTFLLIAWESVIISVYTCRQRCASGRCISDLDRPWWTARVYPTMGRAHGLLIDPTALFPSIKKPSSCLMGFTVLKHSQHPTIWWRSSPGPLFIFIQYTAFRCGQVPPNKSPKLVKSPVPTQRSRRCLNSYESTLFLFFYPLVI